MTKRKSLPIVPRGSAKADQSPSADTPTSRFPSRAAIRETVEQLVFLFAAVFLFRTFAVEAFVIPTGSMAPTLQGRHKNILCPKCNYSYAVGEVVDQEGTLRRDAAGRTVQTEAATCPMCRYTALLGKDNPQHEHYPSCNGDRVEVSKLAYQLHEPQRWDVIVFKFPGDPPTVPPAFRNDARMNYIKRLVGLPGETIRIQQGDVWVLKSEDQKRSAAEFTIARKPPSKLLAMLQPVFNNDYMPQIAQYGWPARWQPELPANGGTVGVWNSDDFQNFHIEGSSGRENWLRYHHLAPSYRQWQQVEADPSSIPQAQPQLITDFTGYDTDQCRADNPAPDAGALGVHWVGDLAVACTADVESLLGELAFELRKGGRRFQCRLNVETSWATLSISGRDMPHWRPKAKTNVQGKGRHDILFSNCDNELLLWIDGAVVSFDAPTTYQALENTRPDDADLAPVGVASTDARVQISHLRVLRDIYYGAVRGEGMPTENGDVQYAPDHAIPDEPMMPHALRPYVDFPLAADQFFVLGDNSARSKDGRLWGADNYWVPRELLIGKAMVLSWPRYSYNIPYLNAPFPFFPNVDRMGLIR